MAYLPNTAYRLKPAVCIAVGVAGLISGHAVGIACGVLLVGWSIWIINCRLTSSRKPCRFCINNKINNRYGTCTGNGACRAKVKS